MLSAMPMRCGVARKIRQQPGRRPCKDALPAAAGPLAMQPSLAESTLHKITDAAVTSSNAPGVYACYDAEATLQYIGVSRSVATSLAGHAVTLPELACQAKVYLVGGAGGKAELQAAWKAWLIEHGSMPPGNAPGPQGASWLPGAAKSTMSAPASAPTPAQLRLRVQQASQPAAAAAVSAEVIRQLNEDGFAIVDGVVDAATIERACAGAELLRDAGLLRQVSSQRGQGREDEILVLDAASSPQPRLLLLGPSAQPLQQQHDALLSGAACQALASVACLLKGLPHVLGTRQQEAAAAAAAAAAAEGGASTAGGAWMPELAVPESLMLAVYPGDGAYYARHVDNDASSSSSGGSSRTGPMWQGPPGQRIADRAVTAIMYLNAGWQGQLHGGQLRVHHPDGSGAYTDVEPVAGRLALFQSRLVEHEVLPAKRQRWALSAWIPALPAYSNEFI